MRKKQRKRESSPGLHINWQTNGTEHFVIETKQGPIHFGIRMSKRPRKGIQLLQGADNRVRHVPKAG